MVPCCLIRGIPAPLKMVLHGCGTQALAMVPAGEFGGKTPCVTPAVVTSHHKGIRLDVYCKMMVLLL